MSQEANDSSWEMNTHMSDILMVRDVRAWCRNVARLCQGNAVKKGISFELAVMTTIPLVVAAVVTSITLNIKKRSKVGTPIIRDWAWLDPR
jgi:hypothetical protein